MGYLKSYNRDYNPIPQEYLDKEKERGEMERRAFRIFMTKILILPFMIVLTGVALVGFL